MFYKITERVPCRLVIGLMIFTGVCNNYMTRVNISVNLLAMAPVTNHTYTDSQVTFNWTAYQRAQVLGVYFWGYTITNTVGGTISDILGPKLMLFIVIFANNLLSFLSPVAAKYHHMALVAVRFITGLASGIAFPAFHVLISKWAVDLEKGRFIGALVGGTIGTFFAWSICGLVIEPWGWEWGFYIFGILGIVWMLALWFLVFDSPEKHPRISSSELLYISKGLTVTPNNMKMIPPYKKIFSSIAFWSLCVLNFGNGWGVYFVITALPNYLSTVLGYGTSSTGLLSAFIYLMRSSSAFGFGYVGDILLKRNVMPVRVLRKLSTVFSHIVPGCLVLCMAIPGFEPQYFIALMIVAMTLNGCVSISLTNTHDLTKNFVGTVAGFVTTSITVAGMVTPFVTAYFTKNNETNQEAWQPVFYVGGSIYILSGLQYLVFSSTEKQSWDQVLITK